MSTDVLGGSRVVARWRLPALLTGFGRFVRAVFASRRRDSDVDGLSERYLQDVGVNRRQISDRVEREIMRSVLVDLSWRGPPQR